MAFSIAKLLIKFVVIELERTELLTNFLKHSERSVPELIKKKLNVEKAKRDKYFLPELLRFKNLLCRSINQKVSNSKIFKSK